jgi:hypothetical protein
VKPPEVATSNKRRLVAVVAGIVVLVAVATAAALATRGGGSGTGTAASPSSQAQVSAAVPDPPPAVSQSSPPPASPSSPLSPTTTTTTSGAAEDTPAAKEKAIVDYYALIPGNLEAAFARLTDKFKAAKSPTLAKYETFWSAYKSVSVVSATAGAGNTVSANLVYTRTNGSTVSEHDVYTLVLQNGSWAIDSQNL